ncbi:UvrD-helicase domain-containing protein [Mesorhizobium sp. M1163]|uniref:UvrD-helicase domain-containing protein n=1 Tax=Mesorhizobium sp. M1163 TaxID=2957065 RepID=UPI0033365C82
MTYVNLRSTFFLVGDPAQSIFGFAGARPELIDSFADEIGAKRDLSLSWNFRSSAPVVEQAERLFPRAPAMTSEGKNKVCTEPAHLITTDRTFDAITEEFLPAINRMGLPLGRSAILAKSWAALYPISRGLRDFGVKVVGPGARPYRRFSWVRMSRYTIAISGYNNSFEEMGLSQYDPAEQHRKAWNAGTKVGAKRALKLR